MTWGSFVLPSRSLTKIRSMSYSVCANDVAFEIILRESEAGAIFHVHHPLSQSVAAGYRAGLIAEPVASFVTNTARKLNSAVENSRSELFEYFGLRTVYDRYLLKNPETREVIETPQYFFLRVAVGL